MKTGIAQRLFYPPKLQTSGFLFLSFSGWTKMSCFEISILLRKNWKVNLLHTLCQKSMHVVTKEFHLSQRNQFEQEELGFRNFWGKTVGYNSCFQVTRRLRTEKNKFYEREKENTAEKKMILEPKAESSQSCWRCLRARAGVRQSIV